MIKPKYHIFICTSSRPTGQQKGMCHTKAGVDIMMKFLEDVDERELGGDVFVSNTGCLGICEKGPVVVVYPDNIWYGSVRLEDVETIMEEHIEKGVPVASLVI